MTASAEHVAEEPWQLDQSFRLAFLAGLALTFAFGTAFSYPPIFEHFLKNASGQIIGGIYLKAGEYGESEQFSPWSIFIEPLNAWSSLAYSLFGFVMVFIGFNDYDPSHRNEFNRLSSFPEFSILYGISAIFLGIASFLFHASHSEVWRKIDAGMTSGVVVPLFLLGVWDRARPIGVTIEHMVIINVILQLSLTYGYLPYGSSDVLLPTFVALAWILELLPRYGGVVSSTQYAYWMQSFYAVIGGMLLRLADIKRKQPRFFSRTILAFYLLTLFPFGFFLGLYNGVIVFGAIAGAYVAYQPPRGHVLWHIASSFALYIWWYMLRTRPGDPSFPFSNDRSFFALALFISVKNALRRIFMSIPFPSDEMRVRCFILLEHIFFTGLGYHILVLDPNEAMLFNPILCWKSLRLSSEAFQLYYTLRISSVFEDVLYMIVKRVVVKEDEIAKDLKMTLHHISAGLLSLFSFVMGYENIGALVMFLHDVSDVPLSCLRLAKALRLDFLVYASYILTLISWVYWRLYYFAFYVIYSVIVHSKSKIYVTDCEVGSCSWSESPERGPFALCLIVLLLLHILWFIELVKKGYRELRPFKELKEKDASSGGKS